MSLLYNLTSKCISMQLDTTQCGSMHSNEIRCCVMHFGAPQYNHMQCDAIHRNSNNFKEIPCKTGIQCNSNRCFSINSILFEIIIFKNFNPMKIYSILFNSIQFCSILFKSILSNSVEFYFVRFNSIIQLSSSKFSSSQFNSSKYNFINNIRFHSIQFSIAFDSIPFDSIPFVSIPSDHLQFNSIRFHSIDPYKFLQQNTILWNCLQRMTKLYATHDNLHDFSWNLNLIFEIPCNSLHFKIQCNSTPFNSVQLISVGWNTMQFGCVQFNSASCHPTNATQWKIMNFTALRWTMQLNFKQ